MLSFLIAGAEQQGAGVVLHSGRHWSRMAVLFAAQTRPMKQMLWMGTSKDDTVVVEAPGAKLQPRAASSTNVNVGPPPPNVKGPPRIDTLVSTKLPPQKPWIMAHRGKLTGAVNGV